MGDMSWLMEIISLPAESGRSPRLPGSNTVEFSQDLCALASLRLCVNFSSSATNNQGICGSTLFFFGCGRWAALGFSVSSVSLC